jgi:hypothetical protein
MTMLSRTANEEVGRLLNGRNHPEAAAIGHLATAACRAAESLIYLADVDDQRFRGVWPNDSYPNEVIDDGHVRWAASAALTSLDLCVAAASRLGSFSQRPPRGEDSIRDFYRAGVAGNSVDRRQLVPAPWRAWIDNVIADARYARLLLVRNALIHADAFRIVHGSSGPMTGHALRYGYRIGPLTPPATPQTHVTVMAREAVELSRDTALSHVGAFVAVLKSMS